MKFTFRSDDIVQLTSDLIGLLCFEDQLREHSGVAALDQALGGLLFRIAEEERFKAKKQQTLLLHTHGRVAAGRVLLCGGGQRKDFQLPDLRGFAARAVKAASVASLRTITLVLPELDATEVERATQLVVEGALLGRYRFDKYLSDESKRNEVRVAECQLVFGAQTLAAARREALDHAVERGQRVAQAVAFARDLINEPAGYMTPRRMAEMAQTVAREHQLECKVLGPKECEEFGMGMYLAVSRGSDEEPRFIHLTYRPKDRTPTKKVVLIGKGVTFDSGGLSLKPSSAMEGMKVDMSGAAAVISAIGALAELGSPCEVHAIAACTENMPSGSSYKLGDVLQSMAGKTVEINNTDAEGRLTLGDAITYALREVQPSEMFDFATLTGACVVALGPHIAGVMSNHPPLVERWLGAARRAGEEMWHLPLPERLKEQLKSDIADMRNTGERQGGALTAGLFLKEFAGETPWVHVDLAGPAAADKEYGHVTKGGTGFAVATILEYLTQNA